MTSGNDVALFIDWDNIAISIDERERNRELRPNLLVSLAGRYGRPVMRRAYADWRGRWQQWMRDVTDAGIQLVHVPLGSTQKADPNKKAKSSVDMKLAIDALEAAMAYPQIGTFVLATSDGDFIHLVHALQSHGRRVIAVGIRDCTNDRFAEAVDEILYYHDFLPAEQATEQALRRLITIMDQLEQAVPYVSYGRLRQEAVLSGDLGGVPEVRMLVDEAETRGMLRNYPYESRGVNVRAIRLARQHELVVAVLGPPRETPRRQREPAAEDAAALPDTNGAGTGSKSSRRRKQGGPPPETRTPAQLVADARQLLSNGGSLVEVQHLALRARELDPNYYGSYYVMADLALRIGRIPEAAAYLRAAIERSTDAALTTRMQNQLRRLQKVAALQHT